MQEIEFVELETAILARAKGYNEPCFAIQQPKGFVFIGEYPIEDGWQNSDGEECVWGKVIVAVPTKAALARWLRNAHEMDINCISYPGKRRCYFFNIERYEDGILLREEYNCLSKEIKIWYPTYEDGLEAGLVKALKLLPDGGLLKTNA